jgi:ubiquitin C-terminal hydrolase
MGVVSHSGTIDSGHYFCTMRGTNGQKWYQCNDEFISETSMKQQGNVSEHAYMLFYKRA